MTTDIEDEIKDEKNPRPLDEDDIALLKTYEVEEFIIGLPISSDGKETPQSNKVRSVAGRIVIQAAERLYHLLPMVYQAFVSVLKPITLLQLHGIIRCWEVTKTGTSVSTVAKTSMAHDNPVLCSAWKDDGTTVFSGGCDKQVKMWPLLSGGQPTTVAMHDSPVTQVAWIPEMNLLVSGSLDKTLRYWYLRTVNPVHTQQLPDCCYSLTVRHPLMVVATADRNLIAFNLQNPQIFYLVGFGLFCLESLLSFWVLQRVYIFFRGNK